MIIIDVATAFSRTPFGRYLKDGEHSAEKFRETVLKPQIMKGDDVLIDFSKVALGVGSSFLEEAFGGLVREGFDKKELLKHVSIKDKMGFYDQQVQHFIEVA